MDTEVAMRGMVTEAPGHADEKNFISLDERQDLELQKWILYAKIWITIFKTFLIEGTKTTKRNCNDTESGETYFVRCFVLFIFLIIDWLS